MVSSDTEMLGGPSVSVCDSSITFSSICKYVFDSLLCRASNPSLWESKKWLISDIADLFRLISSLKKKIEY